MVGWLVGWLVGWSAVVLVGGVVAAAAVAVAVLLRFTLVVLRRLRQTTTKIDNASEKDLFFWQNCSFAFALCCFLTVL